MALTHAPALVDLDVSLTQISVDGVRALAQIPSLERLNLSANVIGDAGVFALEDGAARLTELRLVRCQVGDPGALVLAENAAFAGLTWIDLAENYVTDTGAQALARAPHLDRIVYLNLARNRIGAAGAAALKARFGVHAHL
jgi:hypothetical protein